MSAYSEYQEALERIAALGEERLTTERKIGAEFETRADKAHDGPRSAAKQVQAAKNRIHQQQDAGRQALSRIGNTDLLPSRVRPAKVIGEISQQSLEGLISAHQTAVTRLDRAVDAYERAVRDEALRLQSIAKEEAEAARLRRQREAEEQRKLKEEGLLEAEAAARRHRQIVWIVVSAMIALMIVLVVLVA